jgi:signal transduction histidine kinase
MSVESGRRRAAPDRPETSHDVLSCAKIKAGRLGFVHRELDLYALVAEALEMVRPQVLAARLSAESRIPSPTMAMRDPDKVSQIIVNLLSNAALGTPGL